MRIVGGLAKGRRLAAPAKGTRPTSDIAREALFNTIAGSVAIDGGRVLDLFAGTGAVGLEALSRGAAEAVFVEKNRAALEVLRKNVDTVGLPGATILPLPVRHYLRDEPDEPFDLVFADPPYDMDRFLVYGLAPYFAKPAWLGDGGMVVIERRAGDRWSSPASGAAGSLTIVAEKRYGDSVLWYFRRR